MEGSRDLVRGQSNCTDFDLHSKNHIFRVVDINKGTLLELLKFFQILDIKNHVKCWGLEKNAITFSNLTFWQVVRCGVPQRICLRLYFVKNIYFFLVLFENAVSKCMQMLSRCFTHFTLIVFTRTANTNKHK